MSKKNDTTKGKAIDILIADGTLTLTANSREDIYEQAAELVASIPEGTNWTRGIVEYNAGVFTQVYSLLKD